MAATYEPIMTGTISGSPASFTLSSIPSTYTDLVFVANYSFGGSFGGYNNALYVNGANATHSALSIGTSGAAAPSTYKQNNASSWLTSTVAGSPTTPGTGLFIAHFLNYTNSNMYKTVFIRHNVPSSSAPGVMQFVATYASTSAISSITIIGNSGSPLAEGTVTLYGIKAA
jgi:hypothetical protein